MTKNLFTLFTEVGAGWVMYLLVGLSVLSVAVMLERLIFFLRFSAPRTSRLIPLLAQGKLDEVKQKLAGVAGMEAAAALAAIEIAQEGPAAVEETLACIIANQRPSYERFLSFLGTLGNNAPFLGLFGTVIGIIKAFADLSIGGPKAAGAALVMAGISEALVATAVGIFVAIPAVVAFNSYNRWLKIIVSRTQSLGHALTAHLQKDQVRMATRARLEKVPRIGGEPARAVTA